MWEVIRQNVVVVNTIIGMLVLIGGAVFALKLWPLKHQIELEILDRKSEAKSILTELGHQTQLKEREIRVLTEAVAEFREVSKALNSDNVRLATEQGRQAERLHDIVGYVDRVAVRAGVSDVQWANGGRRKDERDPRR